MWQQAAAYALANKTDPQQVQQVLLPWLQAFMGSRNSSSTGQGVGRQLMQAASSPAAAGTTGSGPGLSLDQLLSQLGPLLGTGAGGAGGLDAASLQQVLQGLGPVLSQGGLGGALGGGGDSRSSDDTSSGRGQDLSQLIALLNGAAADPAAAAHLWEALVGPTLVATLDPDTLAALTQPLIASALAASGAGGGDPQDPGVQAQATHLAQAAAPALLQALQVGR
jgi:hypothetical protein